MANHPNRSANIPYYVAVGYQSTYVRGTAAAYAQAAEWLGHGITADDVRRDRRGARRLNVYTRRVTESDAKSRGI